MKTLFLIGLLPLSSALAQWSGDSRVNTPICISAQAQWCPFTVSDDSGGAIIAWTEPQGDHHSIHAQKINSAGFIEWGAKGMALLPVEPASLQGESQSERVTSIPDGHGGIISVWYSHLSLPLPNGDYSSRDALCAQKINAHGEMPWGTGGLVIASTDNSAPGTPSAEFSFCGDYHGGAYVTWLIAGTDSLALQRIDSSGRLSFPGGSAFRANRYYSPRLCADGAGGAFVVWGDSALQARKVNPSGEVTNLIPVSVKGVQGGLSQGARVLPDGEGGAIITWMEQFTPSSQGRDIRAQHLDHEGRILWGMNGIAVVSVPGDQQDFKLTTDGATGVIVVWEDYRDSRIQSHLYAQHVNRAGILSWAVEGLPVCVFPSSQYLVDICSNGSGGALIAWTDDRANPDIYIQNVRFDGISEWTPQGIPVSSDTLGQTEVSISSDGAGGAILCWMDYRNGNQPDLYGQRVFSNGSLPLKLVDIRINTYEGNTLLSWSTLVETNNYGFRVERSSSSSSGFHSLSFIPGSGTTLEKHDYRFIDSTSISSEPFYRLRQIDLDAGEHFSNVLSIVTGVKEGMAAKEYALYQNYPNPFNPATTIRYELPHMSKVILAVYNTLGQMVASLVNATQDGGLHEVRFEASELASGIYFYSLHAGDFVGTKKLVLMK